MKMPHFGWSNDLIEQCFSTFGTIGPVDKFFRKIGPANVVYFDQQIGALHAVCYSKSSLA